MMFKTIKKIVNLYQDINQKSSQLNDLKQIVKEENDNELIDLAKEDISELDKEIETKRLLFITRLNKIFQFYIKTICS